MDMGHESGKRGTRRADRLGEHEESGDGDDHAAEDSPWRGRVGPAAAGAGLDYEAPSADRPPGYLGDNRAQTNGGRVVQAPQGQPGGGVEDHRPGRRSSQELPAGRDQFRRGVRAVSRGADAGARLAKGRQDQAERGAQLRREQPGDQVLPVQADGGL